MNKSILVCTLGTWRIVPEIMGVLDPLAFPLFPEHCRKEWRNIPGTLLKEIWVVATDGNEDAVEGLKSWWDSIVSDNRRLKIFMVKGTGYLSALDENNRIAEAIFRVVFHAKRLSDERSMRLYLSLAGGRKTMSSFLQKAGNIFGTDGLFHVISSRDAENRARDLSFLEPLPVEVATGFTPVNLGSDDGMEGIYTELIASDFPLPVCDGVVNPLEINNSSLYKEITAGLKESSRIGINFIHDIMEREYRENFKSLYRLPIKVIASLKRENIGVDTKCEIEDISWLKKLPKAELHCHLGGIASGQEIIEIAKTNRSYTLPYQSELYDIFADHRNIINLKISMTEKSELLKRANANIQSDIPEYIRNTYFLMLISESKGLLEKLIDIPDIPVGIKKYEKLGDLQGSKLLQTEAAIKTACKILYKKAVEDNIRYMEVRCSPRNYTKGGLSDYEVLKTIRAGFDEARQSFAGKCQVELIFIGSRHRDLEEMRRHIKLALHMIDEHHESIRVVGFDIAGDESALHLKEFREMLMPLFDRCMRITIHAGETEDVKNIWEAVYYLNADRIGHGLKLLEKKELMERIKNHGTAIELCPTSNYQINGYRDFLDDSTMDYDIYPLKEYMANYLPVTFNTDNPGISKTSLSNEYLKAARLCRGGLSKWDILGIIRCSFKSVFLPYDERTRLLLDVDKEICAVLQ